jgi:hypothetical protein
MMIRSESQGEKPAFLQMNQMGMMRTMAATRRMIRETPKNAAKMLGIIFGSGVLP